MSRYTGPAVKKSRRLKFSTLERGEELRKKDGGVVKVPGQHGANTRAKISEYGKQLQEKQKVRFMYGINERQCVRLFIKAKKTKGVTGYEFLKILESRLDNLVYRLNFARTRRGARQLVTHGHIEVNGSKVDIASYLCKPGDVISVREKDRDLVIIRQSLEALGTNTKSFLHLDVETLSGKYLGYPEQSELNQGIQANLIVEYYNRNI
ncbi:MAG: 30S ribosomal protein S4 [Bacillales bacterium]|jgi:small subunit ribosomal protein S4|nr:30S ribosomal protein S4 [Bacillales bacterium]